MKYSGYTTARMDSSRTAVAAMVKARSPYLSRRVGLGRPWVTGRVGMSVGAGVGCQRHFGITTGSLDWPGAQSC